MYSLAQSTFGDPMHFRESTARKIGARKNVTLRWAAGFTLVETLVVVTIMAILASIILVSVSGMKGSRDLYKAAYDTQGMLEQARTYAMANDTYTWVGLFEEDPNTPGAAGTGQVVMCTVASAGGTNPDLPASPITRLPSSGLIQVTKPTKIPNVHLTVVPAAAVTRPSLSAGTPANYEVGSGSFQNPASPNSSYFLFPLSATSSATAQYTFNQIIQFSPQGDATRIADYPTQLMEVGLQPTHGDQIGTTGANYAVIQITGIGGQVITYRP
jgi:prepilin-type N-terminal cleavage/methylation domain-containing protein